MGSYAVYDSCRCVKARHCADGGTRAEVAGCLTRVVVLPGLGMAMKRWGSARSAEGGCITDYGLFGAGRFLVWFSGVGVLQSMHVEVLEGASYWFRVSCCSPMIDLQALSSDDVFQKRIRSKDDLNSPGHSLKHRVSLGALSIDSTRVLFLLWEPS